MALTPEQKQMSMNELIKLLLNNNAAGETAVNTVVSDKATTAIARQFKVGTIGDITGETGTQDLTGLGITRYRIKPDAAIRVCEDAANVPQAEDWLQAEASWVALTVGEILCHAELADVWSEWRYFPEGYELSNLYFLRDSAGTATATVLVECE